MTLSDVRRDAIDEALEDLRVRVGLVARPGEAGYERCTPFNVAVPVQPAAVVLATTAADVAETMRFAAERGMRVAVQATGHGAVPVGDDTILVFTGGMTSCSVDAMARTARVSAGVVWQRVLDAATPFGLAPVTGSAPGVGVVGFLTGGGVGPFVRSLGLAADYVRAFEVVTGAGEVLRVTPDEHADLFWGLRGGKSTLGIVTEVEIDLLPMAQFYGGALFFSGEDAAVVLHTWRQWSDALPDDIDTSISLQQLPPIPGVPEPLAGRLTVAVRYASLGDAGEAQRLLEPMRDVAPVLIDTVGVMPYAALAAIHCDPADPMPTHEGHAMLAELPADAVDALLAVAGPGSGSALTIVEVRKFGGALAREPRHRSAFCHRAAAFGLATIAVPVPPIAELVAAQTDAVVAALAPWSTGGQMPNFAASDDPGRAARAYSEDAYHWLAALAQRYDPAGVLRTGQAVGIPRI